MKLKSRKFASLAGIMLIALFMPLFAYTADGPTKEQMVNGISSKLPPYIRIVDATIEANQNIGNEVEPVFLSRIRAKVMITESLYEQSGKIDNTTVVNEVNRKGNSDDVYFITQSSLFQGRWNTSFHIQGEPFYNKGKPLSSFTGNVVVKGSQQEQEILSQSKIRSDQLKLIVEQSKKPERKIYEYNYKKTCDGSDSRCFNASIILDDKSLKVAWEGLRNLTVWFGNISNYPSSIHRYGLSGELYYIQIPTRGVFASGGLELYFRGMDNAQSFQSNFKKAVENWVQKFCPQTQAVVCSSSIAAR